MLGSLPHAARRPASWLIFDVRQKMKRLFIFSLICAPLLAGTPTPQGMKSVVEHSAADGIAICKRTLLGKNHAAVRSFLGPSDLNHGEEEYTYHPVRKDGSMWILLIEFDGEKAVDFLGEELLPPPKKKEPNQAPEPSRL